jgi:hypothetical protein
MLDVETGMTTQNALRVFGSSFGVNRRGCDPDRAADSLATVFLRVAGLLPV